MPISEKLRRVIKESGMTRTFISREARIQQRSLNLLLDEDSGVRLQIADRLAEFFGLCFVTVNSGQQKRGSLTDVLHRELTRCSTTRYRIAEDTGIDYAVLSRFEKSETNIQVRTADTLAEYLGLELRKKNSG